MLHRLINCSECLTSVCQIQSNLIQVVNNYLERLGKQTDIQAVHLYSVLESCSLLLGVVPSLAQPISVFLSSIENPFSHWLCANDLKGWTVLSHLLPYVLNEVRMAWNWESIFKFLSCENIRVRYFASQIVCLLLNKTENERNQMESLLGVDRGSCYQSTALMELKKEELRLTEGLYRDFRFSGNVPMLKIPANTEYVPNGSHHMYDVHLQYGDMLFDLDSDPGQERNLAGDSDVEDTMIRNLVSLMKENEAPAEQYERLDLQDYL